MKISDELRGWADVHCGEECEEYLGLLADRIDNETVELPRDKDGEIIRIGDVMYDCFINEDVHIEGMVFKGEWEILTNFGRVKPHWLVHTRPDSFERIADDIEKEKGTVFISEKTLDGWANRIRKLAKEARDGD